MNLTQKIYMKRNKTFLYVFVSCMLVLLYYLNDLIISNKIQIQRVGEALVHEIRLPKSANVSQTDSISHSQMKYILQWTSPDTIPFVFMGKGQQGFYKRNCLHVNCFVTNNKTYLGDYIKFDLIVFHGPELVRMNRSSLPDRRAPHQKFVFASLESADYYPICSDRLNNFFNWTWTYRLESDVKWGYMTVRDSAHRIIGPRKIMHWMKLAEMDPVSKELRDTLIKKSRAAAWFVSNCKSRSGREKFVHKLQEELKKYKLSIDIYGGCGPLKCSRRGQHYCNKIVEEYYYFYLSFENSFAEDYVTEKLLYPLQHNAVPIVYGAANYTRFMPDGIYLNAKKLGVKKLASKMNELISNPDQYAEYFRWKNHYSYHDNSDSSDSDDYCRFCAMLNDKKLMTKYSVVENFRQWWDPPEQCKIFIFY